MAASPSDDALEDALERLLALGIVEDREEGLVTTPEFESTRGIYRDTYANSGDEAFRQAVSETFDVDASAAKARIEAGELTRDDLIAYLSLQSFLDDTDDEQLAVMATLVSEISPGSPVPDSLTELDDDSWAAFLDDHPNAVVTVWRQECPPCEALKDDLDEIRSSIPQGVAVAGIDGESVPAFRQEFGVDTAPAVCCFRGGELDAVVTGRSSPSTYAEQFADCYA